VMASKGTDELSQRVGVIDVPSGVGDGDYSGFSFAEHGPHI
jgi:hypothetical protein